MKNKLALSCVAILIATSSFCQVVDTAFVLSEKDLIPEGITYSASRKTFFVGSIHKRKIVAIDKTGNVRDFIASRQYGVRSFLGLKVDERKNILWAASWGPILKNDETWGTALFKFDAVSGKLLGKYPLMDSTSGFNDLAISSDGSVYITDTGTGAIYYKLPKDTAVKIFLPKSTFEYPNGIALEGESLFVTDETGIWIVSLKTKALQKMKVADGTELIGIDGLSLYKDGFIAVQNGVTPRRVIQIHCNASKTIATKIQVLDTHDVPRKNFSPTTGVMVGAQFYFLSNAQVRSFDAAGNIFPPEQLEPVYIKRIKLK